MGRAMNSRERELAAIRHETPDRLPVDVICIENGNEIAGLLGIEPDAVYDALGIDGRMVAAGYAGQCAEPPSGAPEGINFTEWGTPSTGDYGAARGFYPLAAARSVAEVDDYPWPTAADYDYRSAAEKAADLCPRYAVRGPYWRPLFCRACDLMGMEDAMAAMLTRPAVFEAVLENVFAMTAEYCERLLDACGDAMPILCLGDDFATQRGLMISPEDWRRFLKPRFARLFEIGKSRGKYVWFHSCGDITSVLGDLIDIGMDVWETVQLHTLPMTAQELKAQFGRHVALFGGINTQRLPFTTPENVRAEVQRVIEILGENGGYICGPDHHVKPDVPPENAVALFEEARAFRRRGWTADIRSREELRDNDAPPIPWTSRAHRQ